jgi:hypothetical protein
MFYGARGSEFCPCTWFARWMERGVDPLVAVECRMLQTVELRMVGCSSLSFTSFLPAHTRDSQHWAAVHAKPWRFMQWRILATEPVGQLPDFAHEATIAAMHGNVPDSCRGRCMPHCTEGVQWHCTYGVLPSCVRLQLVLVLHVGWKIPLIDTASLE